MFNMNEKEIQRRLKMIADLQPSPEATARDLERVRNMLTEFPCEHIERPQKIWRKIMNHPATKFSGAAVLLIAILSFYCWSNPGNSLAFADVIKPVLEAKTAVLDLTIIGPDGQETIMQDKIMGSRIRRTLAAAPHNDMIIDLEQMKLLSIDHKEKTAGYVKLEGLGTIPNYFEHLKNLVKQLQNNDKIKLEEQGLQKIDDHERLVFVAKIGPETVTILVDPKTSLPVCIKEQTPNMFIVADHLQFDVPFDESLFSMEIPDGYKVYDTGEIDFKKSNENAFIETLRIWAEIIEGGHFPDSINLANMAKVGLKFDKALKQGKFTDKQTMDIAMKFGQGLGFIRFFKGQGKWYYDGKGVKFGDGTKPVFWYHPQKSETWRVIYGDLSVKDVDAENLPKLSEKQDAEKNAE